MNFTFGGPGQLLLFTSGPPPSSDKQSSPPLPHRQIERISNHTPSPYRRLQNTSHQTFRSLQEGSVSEEKILQSSKTYRTHLQDAENELMNLIEPQQYDNGSYVEPPLPLEIQFTRSLTRQQDASDSPAHAQEIMQRHFEALTAYLQLTEIVWHLCELLHLENSSKPISSNVIDWIQKFEGYVLEPTTDEDIQTISRDRDDIFFPVRYYICHGRIDDAIAACTPILQSYGDQVQEVQELIQLLKDRKNLSPTNKQRGSKRNQQRQWNDWKKDVQEVTNRMEHNGRTNTEKNKNRKRSQKARWTQDEDKLLRSLVKEHDAKNWKKISESFPERTDVQCLHRWQKVLNPNLIKGPWTPEEDAKVKALVKELGPKKWSIIASNLPGRIGKQCRERW